MSEPFASPGGPVRFGGFELEPRSGELRRNGTRVNLPDPPLQLLLALLERRGELVTRDGFASDSGRRTRRLRARPDCRREASARGAR